MDFEAAMRIGYILSHLSVLKDVTKVYNTVWFDFVIENGLYSVPVSVFALTVFVIGVVVDAIGLVMVIHRAFIRRREIACIVYAAFAVMFLGMTSEELIR